MKYFKQLRRLHDNDLKQIENVEKKAAAETEFYDREAEEFLAGFREKDLRDEVDALRAEVNCPERVAGWHKLPFGFRRLGDLRGKRVLDLCCGMGITTTVLAEHGARVSGMDISPRMIEIARRNLSVHGVDDRADVSAMSAEALEFEDETFDLLFGFVGLHHLQPELAGREAARVLKPGGKAVYIDPISGSALLRLIRALTPVACLESPGGGSMSLEDFRTVGRPFSRMQFWWFEMMARLDRLPGMGRHVDRIHRFDTYLLSRFAWLRRYGRYLVAEYVK
ncbi:MAG: methyltransferase domain-containing protein [Candidatus Eisenbacteria sp.]|nr:methyltransferase domain-containing protein [Candidatus Eisenbacteria bacterium]